jgi:hypothetical protein
MEKAEDGQQEGFFPLLSCRSCSRKTGGGEQKLTEAREIWLSILIWLGSCSIGGEKGRTRRAKEVLGGGWRRAEGFVKIVMATFGDFPLFPAKACPLRHAAAAAAALFFFQLFFFSASGSVDPFALSFGAVSTEFCRLSSLTH